MSDTDDEIKRELECERLAADFMQMSRGTLNSDLQAHCVRMASYWSAQADGRLKEPLTNLDDLDK